MKFTHALVLIPAMLTLAFSQKLWAADGEGFASPQEAVNALVTAAPPRSREDEEAKARARAVDRYRLVTNAAT